MIFNKGSTHIVLLLLTCLIPFTFAQTQCSASLPCKQGCCSKYGSCGFGPDFCSKDNCVGTCDAVAECGQYAPSGKSKCPLNVCCSQYGFCGTTTDFCDSKCQNGCDKVSRPSCGGSSASQRTIGYYESWSYNRKCDAWMPENIDPKLWTHLNYAFALIDSGNKISAMNSFDTQLYPRVTGLKRVNPALKVFISVGGWDAGGKVFSNMVSSSGSRSTFINSALAFMNTYGFDGIDIDWEYPVAPDREGVDADFANFVTFIKELKAACGSKYGVTLTLPSSYWYLKGFDIVGLQSYVDWFNIMSYDIHGTWDGNSPFTKAVVAPHTNLTEISDGLDLLWRNKIDPKKVVLGMGFYGRSFTLKDSSCKTPGCPFSSGAKAGACTGTSGVLSNAEIQRIIKQKSLTPILDKAAGIKYMTWDNDQWVSYDDAETLQMKRTYANNLCLGGTMVWALDLDDPLNAQSMKNLNLEGLKLIGDDVDKNPLYAQQKLAAMNLQNNLGLMTVWSQCLKEPECPKGYRKLTIGHGKVFDADLSRATADGCHGGWGGYNRALCIEDSVTITGSCKWYGKPGACKETCPKGQLLISTNSHVGSKSCNNGHFQSYCCDGQISAKSITTCPSSNSNNALGGGVARRDVESGLTVVGTKIECDAYAAQLLGTGAVVGMTIAGYFIYNRLPGSWAYQVGRGWFWVPLRNLVYNALQAQPACTTTTTMPVLFTTSTNRPYTTGCNFNSYPQACAHYMSVVRGNQNVYGTLWCPATEKQGSYRPATAKWNRQHNPEWRRWVDHLLGVPRNGGLDKCNRDEYPGFRFLAERLPAGVRDYTQWVRFLPQGQNKGAGNYWAGVCTTKTSTDLQGGPIANSICTEYLSITTTLNGFVLTAQNQPANMVDDLLTQNPCLPTSLTDDPGFALFTDDVWYGGNINAQRYASASANYPNPPLAGLVRNRVAPRAAPDQPAKRWIHEDYDGVDPSDIIVDDGNSTRRATEEELLYYHNIMKCESTNCEDERLGEFAVDIVGESGKPQLVDPPTTSTGPVPTATPSVTIDSSEASRPSHQGAEETGVHEDAIPERHSDLKKKHLRRHAHGHKHIGRP